MAHTTVLSSVCDASFTTARLDMVCDVIASTVSVYASPQPHSATGATPVDCCFYFVSAIAAARGTVHALKDE